MLTHLNNFLKILSFKNTNYQLAGITDAPVIPAMNTGLHLESEYSRNKFTFWVCRIIDKHVISHPVKHESSE